MSAGKPFAEFDDYGCIVIEGMQSIFTANHSDLARETINAAVAAREKAAAVGALRDYADELEAASREIPIGETLPSGGLTGASTFNVIMREVRSLRARADKLEQGQ